MAAEAQGCSPATGYKWLRRFQAEGIRGLRDRSSRSHRSPTRLSPIRERAILERRWARLEGPHPIGATASGHPRRILSRTALKQGV